jgi:hypothetical protein
MLVDVRYTRPTDPAIVAFDMRQADRDEVAACSGLGPQEAVEVGYRLSTECFTVEAQSNGLPLAMFGYLLDPIGARVWMLGSDHLFDYKWDFLKKSRKWVDYLQQQSPLLYNLIDQRNTVHIRWLQWLDFKFVRTVPHYGVQGLPFIEFVRCRNV